MSKSTALPESCRRVARQASRRATPRDPGELRSGQQVGEMLPNKSPDVVPGVEARPKFDQNWPMQIVCLPMGAKSDPHLAQIGQNCSRLAECWRSWAQLGRTSANICRYWSRLAKVLPTLAQVSQASTSIDRFAVVRSALAHTTRESDKVRPILVETGQLSHKFGHILVKAGQQQSSLVDIAPSLDSRSSCSTVVGQRFANFRTVAKLAGVTGGRGVMWAICSAKLG